MIGYPLDSVVSFDDNGTPKFDRAISSAPLRELIKRLFSDGILPDRSNDLKVQYVGTAQPLDEIEGAINTYNVLVNPGFGICGGCLKLQEVPYGLEINTANTTNPRIDTIVLRLDDNVDVRSCTFYVKQGVEASNPEPPSLIRNLTVWEIGLANINKPATVSVANPITVTDTRLDTDRCGIISSISEFDTVKFYEQIQADLAHFKSISEAEFNTWFVNLQTQLSGDVAANLQGQIGALSLLMTANKTSLVGAINEVLNGSIARTPTRTVSAVSSQSLNVNPIPTSWEQMIAGMSYQSGDYNVTASGFGEGGEAYKAFDNNDSTAWSGNVISGAFLMLELPTAILIDKIYLKHTAPPASTLTIEYSHNGYDWLMDTMLTSSTTNGLEIELSGNTAKYWRLNFSAAGNASVNVFEWKITDYTVTTYQANFSLDSLSSMVDGQVALIHIDPAHNASGIVSNTFNGIPVHSILQAGKRYELMYHTTYFTVKEIG